jgi:hypothetical protein
VCIDTGIVVEGWTAVPSSCLRDDMAYSVVWKLVMR